MNIRSETEQLLDALKSTYFSNQANGTIEYLQGECKLLSLLRLDKEKNGSPENFPKLLEYQLQG